MTREEARKALREKYERVDAALATLPVGVYVICISLDTSENGLTDFIQLWREGTLPKGPETVIENPCDATMVQHSVFVSGVKVLWFTEKEMSK